MTRLSDKETFSSEGPQCPYCECQITADESFYYDSSYDEEECPHCGKTFKVMVNTETTWDCHKGEPTESETI
jgi:hypothetical protein